MIKPLISHAGEVVLVAVAMVVTMSISHLVSPNPVSARSGISSNHPKSSSVSFIVVDELMDDDEPSASNLLFLPLLTH